jgi:effector-binding domain-containing protein
VAGYQSITLGGKALKVDYYGDYAGSEQAHVAIMEYIDQNGLTAKEPVIELYITDPGMEPDTSKWLTTIYYLVE